MVFFSALPELLLLTEPLRASTVPFVFQRACFRRMPVSISTGDGSSALRPICNGNSVTGNMLRCNGGSVKARSVTALIEGCEQLTAERSHYGLSKVERVVRMYRALSHVITSGNSHMMSASELIITDMVLLDITTTPLTHPQ